MHFIKKISDTTGIPEPALQDDLKKVEQELLNEKREITEAAKAESKMYRKDHIERKLAGIAFWKQDKELENKLGKVIDKYRDSKNDLIFEAEVFYESSGDLPKEVERLLDNWEAEKINEELMGKIQELRMVKDKDKEVKLLQEIQELSKKKHEKKEN